MLSTLRVHLLTWNVVGRDPDEKLLGALGIVDSTTVRDRAFAPRPNVQVISDASGDIQQQQQQEESVLSERLPDIYAIGLQEVSARPQAVLMGSLGFEDPWSKRLRETLAPYGYVKMKSIRLQGLLLLLFVERRHVTYLRGVQTEYTRTGLRRMWGNKGAVTIRANFYGCSVCFVNCHLAAHEGEFQQRVEDYNTIVDTQVFSDPETENILYHDYVFWFGDLNFRITGHSAADIDRIARDGHYDRLLETDQLMMAMKSGEAFAEFKEVRPAFRPSYKYIVGTGDDYDLQRRPSWTDRILFKANPNVYENVTLTIEPERYEVHDSYTQSDHKPVSATFTFKVFQGYVESRVKFSPLRTWAAGEEVLCQYTCHGDLDANSWDWIGIYKADFTSVEEYVTYVWAARELMPSRDENDESKMVLQEQQSSDSDSEHEKRGRRFCVTFAQDAIAAAVGFHRFLYVSSQAGNVLGMSEPFEIALKR